MYRCLIRPHSSLAAKLRPIFSSFLSGIATKYNSCQTFQHYDILLLIETYHIAENFQGANIYQISHILLRKHAVFIPGKNFKDWCLHVYIMQYYLLILHTTTASILPIEFVSFWLSTLSTMLFTSSQPSSMKTKVSADIRFPVLCSLYRRQLVHNHGKVLINHIPRLRYTSLRKKDACTVCMASIDPGIKGCMAYVVHVSCILHEKVCPMQRCKQWSPLFLCWQHWLLLWWSLQL